MKDRDRLRDHPEKSVADRYPPEELGDPCPDCGAKEKWIWLDGRRLCRPCVIRGGPLQREAKGISAIEPPRRRRPWW
jgi:hypothetical protein